MRKWFSSITGAPPFLMDSSRSWKLPAREEMRRRRPRRRGWWHRWRQRVPLAAIVAHRPGVEHAREIEPGLVEDEVDPGVRLLPLPGLGADSGAAQRNGEDGEDHHHGHGQTEEEEELPAGASAQELVALVTKLGAEAAIDGHRERPSTTAARAGAPRRAANLSLADRPVNNSLGGSAAKSVRNRTFAPVARRESARRRAAGARAPRGREGSFDARALAAREALARETIL